MALDAVSGDVVLKARGAIKDMNAKSWISSATRVLFITCNMYQPSYDLWVVVNIVIEFNNNRLAYPTQIDIISLPEPLQRRQQAFRQFFPASRLVILK